MQLVPACFRHMVGHNNCAGEGRTWLATTKAVTLCDSKDAMGTVPGRAVHDQPC